MPGTKEGAAKARLRLIEKLGGEEEYKKWVASVGAKGGAAGFGPDYKGGFAGNKDLARRAGRLGGAISRRKAKIAKDINDVYESGILG